MQQEDVRRLLLDDVPDEEMQAALLDENFELDAEDGNESEDESEGESEDESEDDLEDELE